MAHSLATVLALPPPFFWGAMDGYLKRRLANPAFAGGALDESSAYKRFAIERSMEERASADVHPLYVARFEASASELRRVTDHAKKGPCWDGYEKVEGKADYAPDSCQKKGETEKKKKKKRDKSKTKKKKTASDTSSSDSEPEQKN